MPIQIQDVAALLTVVTGFYLALANRTSVQANAQNVALEGAMKSVELREKDILFLERKVERLERYIHYIGAWIQKSKTLHIIDPEEVPLTLSEFEVELEDLEEEDGTN